MPKAPSFESLRDLSFNRLLSKAFHAFPKKVEDLLVANRWPHYTDFMAAVERSGKLLARFKGGARALEEQRDHEALKPIYDEYNTQAMNTLLSGTFFGEQEEGFPDPELVKEVLAPYEIDSWKSLSTAILKISTEAYESFTGRSPGETAKEETIQMLGLQYLPSEEGIRKAMKAFEMPSLDHLKAVFFSAGGGDLTVEDLDRSVGDPEYLTEVVNRSPSNPYKGIVFGAVDPSTQIGYSGVLA